MSIVGGPSSTARLSRNQKVCTHWRSGKCRYGEKCRFKHGNEENSGARNPPMIANVRESAIDGELIENVDTPVSPVFSEVALSDTGNGMPRRESILPGNPSRNHGLRSRRNVQSFVTRDNDTGFEQAPQDTAARVPTDLQAAGVASMTRVCRYWNGSGGCARGDKCSYQHIIGSPSLDLLHKTKAQGKQRRGGLPNQGATSRQGAHRLEEERRKQEEKRREEERLREEHRLAEESRLAEQIRIEEERRADEERHREEERRRELERRRDEEQRKERERVALEEREARWRNEAAVVEQYVVFDLSLVTFAAGLDIRNIVTGFDLCCITIKNLPRDAKVEEIADIFLQQGISSADFFVTGVKGVGDIRESVILANAEYGQALAIGLEGIEFRDKSLTFEITDKTTPDAMGATGSRTPFMTVTWRIPINAIVANYVSQDEAQRRVRELNGQNWKGHSIKVTINDYNPRGFQLVRNSVKITNIPENAASDLDFFNFIGTYSIRSLKTAPYDHLNSHLTVRTHLTQQRGAQSQTYEVLPTDDKNEVRIKVQFDDWEDVKLAHESVHNKKLGLGMLTPNLRAWHPHPLQYTIKIPSRQYLAQKKLWDGLSEKRAGKEAFVQTRQGDRGDIVFVRVLGNNKKATGALKVRVESLVSGEALGVDYWHPSFISFRASKSFFDRAFEETGAFIRTDFKTRTLKVYGEAEKVDNVRRLIEEEVRRLQGLETTRVIDRGSIAFFVREGVGRLKELIGEENVTLHLASRPCRIMIKGGQEATHHLQRLIEESRKAGALDISQTTTGEEDTCPVCTSNASNPEQLGCGHTYCAGCLRHFLSSAAESKTFPLVCMGNDATCNDPISIPFIRRFMPEQAFKHLTEVAFTCYLESHPQVYKYCPTADCKQVYRRQTQKKAIQCPSCFSSVCPACDEEAHEGLTCEESRFQRDPAAQEQLNERLGYRKCPQCRGWIEKNGGCNHMTCQCGAHICWRCMGVFPQNEIYMHMNTVHGGISDELPAGVDADGVPARNFVVQQADALAQIELERRNAERRAQEVLRLEQERARQRQAEDAARRAAQEIRQYYQLQEEDRVRRRQAEEHYDAEIFRRRQEVQRRTFERYQQERETAQAQTQTTRRPGANQREPEGCGRWCVVM